MVSFRLMEALRRQGVDARMLVCEKLTDSPYVSEVASNIDIKKSFILERLKIFVANGFNKKTLFKIDTGQNGLPLWNHPEVREADAILLNWVNQGMLSLDGLEKILQLNKPVIWTMHDMWCMTGICHHAGTCVHFHNHCGNCPLLESKSSPKDLSYKVWEKKHEIYIQKDLTKKLVFVSVSNWLKNKSAESSLLKDKRVEVIPNAFPLDEEENESGIKREVYTHSRRPIRILFGAARLDDPIKGLDTLREATGILKERYIGENEDIELALFGNIKNPEAFEGFKLPLVKLGVLIGEKAVRQAYENSDILVSASSYETLPGTLVEAQAYGCIPVSFNQGGQADIISNSDTGIITEYSESLEMRAHNLAKGIQQAIEIVKNSQKHKEFQRSMRRNVIEKFSYNEVARKYISLIQSLEVKE